MFLGWSFPWAERKRQAEHIANSRSAYRSETNLLLYTNLPSCASISDRITRMSVLQRSLFLGTRRCKCTNLRVPSLYPKRPSNGQIVNRNMHSRNNLLFSIVLASNSLTREDAFLTFCSKIARLPAIHCADSWAELRSTLE